MPFLAKRFQRNRALELAANNAPPLRRGATGEAVIVLQQALIDLGFTMPISTARSVVPDGQYGPETEATVRAFQAANGLSADGIAGRDTLGLMDRLFTAREAAARAQMVAAANTPAPVGPWYMT